MYVIYCSIGPNKSPSQSVWIMNFVLEICYYSINTIPLYLFLGLQHHGLVPGPDGGELRAGLDGAEPAEDVHQALADEKVHLALLVG